MRLTRNVHVPVEQGIHCFPDSHNPNHVNIFSVFSQPMEQGPLKNSDLLIMCSLTQAPTANPDAMIGEFCVNTGM